jgi:16S rRNA pseudouridine516 synthase
MKALPIDKPVRLDRFLSHSAGLSRSEAKKLLHAGCVLLDGQPVRDSGLPVTSRQQVSLHGKVLEWPRLRYLMLHKPAGYVCSTEDPGHPLVTELVEESWATSLHSAGRLDVDTTGLVLLTNDGTWSHALTSPRRHCLKTYLVTLKHPLAADVAERFTQGVMLHGETKPTLPARLEPLDEHTARVHINEGRYHQVKRMFAACGNRVESLHRESIGAIVLDTSLQAGQWRELQAQEVEHAADA